MYCEVGEQKITVDDYGKEGKVVKVDGEEIDGIHNCYYSVKEIERDLAKVVAGYVKGMPEWQEGEYA
jgi:hypothetical protein